MPKQFKETAGVTIVLGNRSLFVYLGAGIRRIVLKTISNLDSISSKMNFIFSKTVLHTALYLNINL